MGGERLCKRCDEQRGMRRVIGGKRAKGEVLDSTTLHILLENPHEKEAHLGVITDRITRLSIWRRPKSLNDLWNRVNELSLGRSTQSFKNHKRTSHYQKKEQITSNMECIITHLNGSQFRQVCSITHITIKHSETQRRSTE